MFRKRQNLTACVAVPIVECVLKELDDGTCERSIVSASRVLPPVANYDLTTQLRAGVNLEEVNTKILSGRSSRFVFEQKEEVNNEK